MMIKKANPFADLNRLERALWMTSLVAIAGSTLLSGGKDFLSTAAALIGVTALIFVAKGYVIGQILTVVFAVFYGVISFYFRYYGEMITYLGMTAPSAICTAVAWMRHPYAGTREVEVNRLSKAQKAIVILGAAATTAVFYLILKKLGNANLLWSTVSVTTSFLASGLTFFRSPCYALAYAANVVILIILWIAAAAHDPSCLPMVICFAMFLMNDLYGFFNWRRMAARQAQ